MTTIYKAGGVKSDTPAGFRVASAQINSTTRVKLKDGTGADFKVSAGKTFYIGYIYWTIANGMFLTLMYDDDGAGANETNLIIIPMFEYSTDYDHVPQVIECVIAVPAGKYLTGKVSAATSGYVVINGQEI